MPVKSQFITWIHALQNTICTALELTDGSAAFREDRWDRDGGGGGITRVIENGNVFEKGGVNTSVVHGLLPEPIKAHFKVDGGYFMAAGISLVLHPLSPFIPTVHANYRYFELYDKEGGEVKDNWFGGGADLTPWYLDEDDARHFHRVHKKACDTVDTALYPEFKKACDRYFFNTHRGETRGIGGIFYDYLRPDTPYTSEQLRLLAHNAGDSFLSAYLPLVEKHKNRVWSEKQRHWQEIRRGRYVEFNLIHDRGTLFGLKTNGRVESILMSLPPRVRWEYDFKTVPGSDEEKLIQRLKHPVEWV